MTEIPEHLRKRAEEARAKAAGTKGDSSSSPESDTPVASGEVSSTDEKIPAHLLDRGKAASDQPAPVESSDPGLGTGPDGNTQRLLAVVKSGSIQDTKATPIDKVHVWPHLLVIEFLAALGITCLLYTSPSPRD